MKCFMLRAFASAVLLAACSRDKSKTGTDSAATASTPAAATPSASTNATNSEAAAPITGQTIEVKMLQDTQGNYRFDPADITIKSGDGVKFTMVSGGPHNVAFDPTQIPAAAK